jgi:hypothetical protein
MSDCAPWVNDVTGRIRVSPSGYFATEYGEMTYSTIDDTVYRYIGVGYDTTFLNEAYALIVAQPTQVFATPADYFGQITIGNGSYEMIFHQSEGFCDVAGRVTFGTTSTIDGLVAITFPFSFLGVPSVAASSMITSSWGYYSDFSAVAYYPLVLNFDNPTASVFWLRNVSGAGSATATAVLVGSPVAIGAGDTITFGFRFPIAEPRTA